MKYDTSQPITFLEGLGLLFIALKLTGQIDWSWVWVLAPVWIPLVAFGVAFLWIVLRPRNLRMRAYRRQRQRAAKNNYSRRGLR